MMYVWSSVVTTNSHTIPPYNMALLAELMGTGSCAVYQLVLSYATSKQSETSMSVNFGGARAYLTPENQKWKD